MKLKHSFFYSILTSIFLSLSWPAYGFVFFVFFSLVPLLYFEYKTDFCFRKLFFPVFVSFLLWNLFTTYWIMYSSLPGMLIAVFLNSLFMSFVFISYSFIRRKINLKTGLFSLIFLWISFEFLHYNWDLSWSWLTLGNVFSNSTYLIQWYEFTGVLGGTLWILLSNILIFLFVLKKNKKFVFAFGALFVFLFVLSMYSKNENLAEQKIDVIIVQPNIDPWEEKFSKMTVEDQVNVFVDLSKSNIDKNVDFIVAPETFLYDNLWEDGIEYSPTIKLLTSNFHQFPNLNFIVGATTLKRVYDKDTLKFSAKRISGTDIFYEFFNSLIYIKDDNSIKIHQKSKLVPGTEIIPLPFIFGKLSKIFENMGGVSSSLGKGNKISVFQKDSIFFSTSICYESIFGESISRSFQQGSQCLFVITNDGWWKDSPGYKQHLSYSRLRAIENRKPIIRCANTGISCFIDHNGKVIKKTNWWTKDSIREQIVLNDKLTFYSMHGDYLGRLSVFLSFMIVIYSFVFIKIKSKN